MPKELIEKKSKIPDTQKPIRVPKTMEENISEQVANLLNKAGTIKLTKEQKEILYTPVPKKQIEKREDGLYYLPWTFYADRLRKAFGNEWAQIPAGKPVREGNLILQPFWLFIRGIPQAWAMGQQKYHPTNPKMTYGDAIEACKSNALMRLGKSLGIGAELWDRKFLRKLEKEYRKKIKFFTKEELKIYSEQDTDEEIIQTELEHRKHFVYSYKPRSPVVFSQLSRMKFKTNDKQWEQWKEKAKEKEFKKVDADHQLAIIDEFAIDIEDAKKVLEKKASR